MSGDDGGGDAPVPIDALSHKVTEDASVKPVSYPDVPHRLATVSASQALQDLRAENREHVKTGLESLDSMLASGGNHLHALPAGKTIEIWGPPGSGKTALALQISRNTIDAGRAVLWMDAMSPISKKRLQQVIFCQESISDPRGERFRHVQLDSLSHLLCCILHPSPDTPSTNTSLVVIDGLYGLLDLDYPRFQSKTGLNSDQYKWRVGRRQAILGSIVVGLNKLAALRSVTVLVTTGCASRMRPDHGGGAALVPGVGGPEWEAGIWHRLCLLRDHDVRCLGVQKCSGRSCVSRVESGETGPLLPFEIREGGDLVEVSGLVRPAEVEAPVQPSNVRKRSFSEVADSEEELDQYDWLEGDESLLIATVTQNDPS